MKYLVLSITSIFLFNFSAHATENQAVISADQITAKVDFENGSVLEGDSARIAYVMSETKSFEVLLSSDIATPDMGGGSTHVKFVGDLVCIFAQSFQGEQNYSCYRRKSE